MAQVNPGEAAFEGFRLIRREPVQLVFWGLAAAAFYLVVMGLMKGTGYMESLSRLAAGGGNPMQMMGGMFGFVGGLFLLEVVFYAVIACAIYRGVLRPQEAGPGRFRFGGDELRMMGLFAIMIALSFVACLVLGIVLGIVGAVVGVGAAASRGGAGMGAMLPLIMLFYLGGIAFFVWFGVQFSMAAPMTFAERRISVFRSWRLVKGNFWRLLGCFVLVFILALLVAIIIFVAQVIIFGAVGAPSPMAAFSHPGQMPDMSARFTPIALVAGAVSAVLGGVFYPIWFAPQAAAYRDIVGVAGEKAAEVFG